MSEGGQSGQSYGAASSILDRKFRTSHVTINAQLEGPRKASLVKPHNPTGLISSSVFVSTFVNLLKE